MRNDLRKITVLYVEDDTSVQEAMESFFGFRVKKSYVAFDGEEGLALFKKHKDEIQVVVTDIQMPHMDGLEMISKIQQIEPNMRFIITTAFDDTKYLLKSIELGVNAYLTKPIDLRKLTALLQEQYNLLRFPKNKALYDSALSLVLDLHELPSVVMSEDEVLAANDIFLERFHITDITLLTSDIKGQLLLAVKSNIPHMVIGGILYDITIEQDPSKLLFVISLDANS
jgi:YesN/AraC family two-component response regulator